MTPLDMTILILTIALPLLWYFRDSLPLIGGRSKSNLTNGVSHSKSKVDEGDPRDFVAKMEKAVSLVCLFP